MLQLPGATPVGYTEQVGDILALLRGSYRSPDGLEARAVPGEHADVQVWITGSSGGESAQVAGDNGLRFAANYHVAPGTVLEAVDGYRAAFRPSAELARPYCRVSADVVVAPSGAEARELAAGFGPWVPASGPPAARLSTPPQRRPGRCRGPRRIRRWWRTGWTRGSSAIPDRCATQLEQLREATGADELLVTTITHQHADRVRSYQLLAQEWARR